MFGNLRWLMYSQRRYNFGDIIHAVCLTLLVYSCVVGLQFQHFVLPKLRDHFPSLARSFSAVAYEASLNAKPIPEVGKGPAKKPLSPDVLDKLETLRRQADIRLESSIQVPV
jgi:hypothetical protein